MFLKLSQACQVVLAHNIILFQGVVPVNHHHRVFQTVGGTALGGAALGLFQTLGLFQLLGIALLFLPSFSKVAFGFSKPEEELAAVELAAAAGREVCLEPPALGPSEVESCSNFLATASAILPWHLSLAFSKADRCLARTEGSGGSAFSPLHLLPSFLSGLGSGPMTKLPPLSVGGPFQLVHLFQDFPVQVGFSNLGLFQTQSQGPDFSKPKPCFSSKAFPSQPTATSYKWCCSCMC